MFYDRPSQIEDRLFLGSMSHANDRHVLKRLLITHVLTICHLPPTHYPDISYRFVSLNDLPSEPISHKFAECHKFIDAALARGGRVLVHCYAGVSRSATVVIAYLMRKRGLSYPEAFGHVQTRRAVVRPNYGFVQQLLDFSQRLQRLQHRPSLY